MKTNPNAQVRRNGSAARAAKQASTETKPAARSHGTAKVAQPVTLVFTGPDGSECARVTVPGELFTRFRLATRRLGVSMAEFVEQAVREDMNLDAASLKGGTL